MSGSVDVLVYPGVLPPQSLTSAIKPIRLVTKLAVVHIYTYNVLKYRYVYCKLYLANDRIIVILLVISENIASWGSFYFRTSTFKNVLYHWSVFQCAQTEFDINEYDGELKHNVITQILNCLLLRIKISSYVQFNPGFFVGSCCSSSQFSVLCLLFCLSSYCVLCTQCCVCVLIVHS